MSSPRVPSLLWLPLGGVAIGQRFLLPGVSLADVCLAAFVALALWRLRREPWPVPAWTSWLAAFCVWTVASGIWAAALDPGFSGVEFVKSLAKLLFYGLAALVLARVVRAEGLATAVRVAAVSLACAASLAIALYAAMQLRAPLPYDALCGEANRECATAYYYELRWFGDNSARSFREGVHVRAIGVAGEPSRLGVLLGLGLGFVLLAGRARPPVAAAVVIATAAALTFSLSAYALLLPVLGLWALQRLRAGGRGRRAWLAVGAVAVVACLPPVTRTLHRTIVVRSQRILEGRADSSARLRVLGSWDMATLLARTHPLRGVGLGHFDLRVQEVAPLVPGGHMLDGTVQGWNALAYVLATTGAVGLVSFLLMGYAALRKSPALALVFLAGTFADSTVLGPAFWVFFALYASAVGGDGVTGRAESPS